MWLITNFGFYSIVQKPGDKRLGQLTIRSRTREDLENLKSRYLREMSDISESTNSDYRFRATAPTENVAKAFAQALAGIDYSNFKNSVAEHQGSKREQLCHEVWHVMMKLQKR